MHFHSLKVLSLSSLNFFGMSRKLPRTPIMKFTILSYLCYYWQVGITEDFDYVE